MVSRIYLLIVSYIQNSEAFDRCCSVSSIFGSMVSTRHGQFKFHSALNPADFITSIRNRVIRFYEFAYFAKNEKMKKTFVTVANCDAAMMSSLCTLHVDGFSAVAYSDARYILR